MVEGHTIGRTLIIFFLKKSILAYQFIIFMGSVRSLGCIFVLERNHRENKKKSGEVTGEKRKKADQNASRGTRTELPFICEYIQYLITF
jgi:hypothetical protein